MCSSESAFVYITKPRRCPIYFSPRHSLWCVVALCIDWAFAIWLGKLNGFLILDKNEAQSFCKELVFLDGSFPNNSCASKLSYSICNLWTQFSNIYK
jgi:hypothetical protein